MTKDDILSMAEESGFAYIYPEPGLLTRLERFAALVAEKEREECAKVCEREGQSPYATKHAAANIRARGQK